MSQKKIIVIKLKQMIYGAIFVILGIILIILLVSLFTSGKDDSDSVASNSKYTAGIYTSVINLNDTTLNLEIVVDKDHINSVRIVNLDESVTTMYPLVEPAINDIEDQLCNDIDIDSISVSEERKYTQTLLIDAVKQTLEKATVKEEN
ncbi:hypothetical protein [Clostridium sp. Marseille-P299]|uniref:hypothetical protein n=1 Tax=Clostridium sp. Marseille-P299 TaxID=1805477 RepID=UPI00082A922B|nr:hypothetical protein [Clostridium sp. Marseille-P299]